jgi:hypothetical protein
MRSTERSGIIGPSLVGKTPILDSQFRTRSISISDGAVSFFEEGRVNWISSNSTVLDTPNRIVHSCKLGPSTTTGEATYALLANGYWGFKGRAWESGLLGHNYRLIIYSNVLDASGQAIGAYHEGDLKGSSGVGKADTWEDTGWDQRIIDNWEALQAGQFTAEMRVDTKGWDIAVVVMIGVALVVPIAILGGHAASGGKVGCDPHTYSDDAGGAGGWGEMLSRVNSIWCVDGEIKLERF